MYVMQTVTLVTWETNSNIITLTLSGLNISILKRRLVEWIKKRNTSTAIYKKRTSDLTK